MNIHNWKNRDVFLPNIALKIPNFKKCCHQNKTKSIVKKIQIHLPTSLPMFLKLHSLKVNISKITFLRKILVGICEQIKSVVTGGSSKEKTNLEYNIY